MVLQQWGYDKDTISMTVKALVRPPLADVKAMMASPSTLRASLHAFHAQAGIPVPPGLTAAAAAAGDHK